VSAVSYVFLYADFVKNIPKLLTRTIFTQIENLCIDYCWMLHREEPQTVHKRKSSKRSFEEKKKRYYKNCWHCSNYNKQL